MYTTLKNLSAIAAISFTLAFCTGMSATLMYQEHMALKPFIAVQTLPVDLSADMELENIDFS